MVQRNGKWNKRGSVGRERQRVRHTAIAQNEINRLCPTVQTKHRYGVG